ncbi:hypothetical protein BLNAU_5597 [Blattamonas nauphoetae]|uniref:Uncharacterized protein n=1 Tax=Blattamonas nauphoetae TaxID=2049346 RepID=A0ABQ9Y6Z9_9EUKA|nr:hypothetical protein BLNAU_5597 [Blattamonas nauphoetae]
MFLRPNDKFNLSVDDVMTKLVPTSHPYEGFITAFKVLISSKYESVIVAALTLFHTLIHRATSAITQHILRYNPTQAFFQSNMLRSLPIVGHEQLHTAIFKVFKRFSNRVIGLTLFNMIIRPAGPYLKRVLSQWRILTDETGELKTFSSLLHTLVYLSVFRNETSDFVLSLPVAHIVTSLLSQRVTVYMNDKLFYKLCQTVTQATKDHKFSFFRWKEMLARLSSEGLLDEMEQMMVPVKHRGRTQGLNSIQPRAMSIKIGCNVAPLHRV